MAFKILATSDLHLGKKSSEIPLSEKESSVRYTWEKIVDWCIRHSVDALVLAGDIIDRDNRYFESVGPLQSGLEKLDRAGIHVLITAGNHDYDVLPAALRNKASGNIRLLGANGQWESITLTGHDMAVQFIGWSFPGQFMKESPLLHFSSEGLDPELPSIGIFHGDAYDRNSVYGPFDAGQLYALKPDAWIVGHIHKPASLRNQDPVIRYPGSPHALSPKETGIHGPLLITVESRHRLSVNQVALSPVRYETININVSEAKDENSFRDLITSSLLLKAESFLTELEEVKYLVFDIVLEGRHPGLDKLSLWSARIEEYRQELETGTVIIPRKVMNMAVPDTIDLEALASQTTPAGIIAETILSIRQGKSTDFLESLRKQWHTEHDKMILSGTYQPLLAAGDKTADADSYILRECNRLLAELTGQQEIK